MVGRYIHTMINYQKNNCLKPTHTCYSDPSHPPPPPFLPLPPPSPFPLPLSQVI